MYCLYVSRLKSFITFYKHSYVVFFKAIPRGFFHVCLMNFDLLVQKGIFFYYYHLSCK